MLLVCALFIYSTFVPHLLPTSKKSSLQGNCHYTIARAFTGFRWSRGRKMNFMNNSIMVYPSRGTYLSTIEKHARNSLQLMKLRLENYIALSLDCYISKLWIIPIIMVTTHAPTSLPGSAIASWSSCVHVAIYLPMHTSKCLWGQNFAGKIL